jgi:hypothetical protein
MLKKKNSLSELIATDRSEWQILVYKLDAVEEKTMAFLSYKMDNLLLGCGDVENVVERCASIDPTRSFSKRL